MALVAVALAGVAGLLAVRAPLRTPSSRVGERPGGSRATAVVLLTGAAGAVFWFLSGSHLVLGLIGLLVAAAVSRLVAASRAAASADRRAEQVLGVCDAMASDLGAGQPPLAALERAALDWAEFAPVATAGRLGADVPQVLRALADLPGAAQLRVLAASWQVAHRSGAGLADALAQAATGIREERQTMRMVAAELAAAHATARMMAVLPAGVLLLGAGVGGDPVGFLTGTPVGLGCLGSGLLLTYLGLVWLQHISDAVLGR